MDCQRCAKYEQYSRQPCWFDHLICIEVAGHEQPVWAANTVLCMRDDYFMPLTATMLNFAYFSPILSAA